MRLTFSEVNLVGIRLTANAIFGKITAKIGDHE